MLSSSLIESLYLCSVAVLLLFCRCSVVVLCGCSGDVSSGYCSAPYLTASDDPLPPKWRLLTLPDFYAFSNCSRAGSVVIILKIADDGLNLGTQ